MPRELIAPAQEQVAVREYESPPLQANEVRVRSKFARPNMSQRWHCLRATLDHGAHMIVSTRYFGPKNPAWCVTRQVSAICVSVK